MGAEFKGANMAVTDWGFCYKLLMELELFLGNFLGKSNLLFSSFKVK